MLGFWTTLGAAASHGLHLGPMHLDDHHTLIPSNDRDGRMEAIAGALAGLASRPWADMR
jgi:hypothetical protein